MMSSGFKVDAKKLKVGVLDFVGWTGNINLHIAMPWDIVRLRAMMMSKLMVTSQRYHYLCALCKLEAVFSKTELVSIKNPHCFS
jgi:hypothetical protein